MSAKSTVIGITPAFIEILNYETEEGSFITADHYNNSLKVCVLGAGLANSFFSNQSALGKMVKVDDQWLRSSGSNEVQGCFYGNGRGTGLARFEQRCLFTFDHFQQAFCQRKPARERNQANHR